MADKECLTRITPGYKHILSAQGLCDRCTLTFQSFDPRNNYSKVSWGLQVFYPEFKELDNSHCISCQTIQYALKCRIKGSNVPSTHWEGVIVIQSVTLFSENAQLHGDRRLPVEENGLFHYDVWIEFPGQKMKTIGIPFKVYTDHGNPLAIQGLVRRQLPGPDILSTVNIRAIKAQLQGCSGGHTSCQNTGSDPAALPKRLVEIRNDQMHVRLVETDALDSAVCYAALSHVRGDPETSAPFLMTTEETLRDRLRTIEFQDLPLTFRDAIRLSAALGITYIWIDSLCIIQDSKSDWASEAPRMCTIYTNATLTIAATCATTAHHGFLERTASDFPPTRIYCRISMSRNTIPGYLYLIPMNTHWGYDDVTMELEGSVWNGRGWTFQERILSRRILHFIKDKWIFECQNGNASEDNRPPGSFFNRMPWLGGKIGSDKASLSANDLLDNYREVVQAYTGRALTRVSDRLAAFSGVIQRISDLTGEANIAGLWRSRLPQDLLWYTYPQIPSSRKPITPRAPSWSWVAWDGQIGYHYNRDEAELLGMCDLDDRDFTYMTLGLFALPVAYFNKRHYMLLLRSVPEKLATYERVGHASTGSLRGRLTFPMTRPLTELSII